jgi:hypothetical protein
MLDLHGSCRRLPYHKLAPSIRLFGDFERYGDVTTIMPDFEPGAIFSGKRIQCFSFRKLARNPFVGVDGK